MTGMSHVGALGVLLGMLGCADGAPTFVSLRDGEAGFSFNFAPGPMGDDIHQPYGVGAQVLLTASHASPNVDHGTWFAEFESGAPAHVVSQTASKDLLSVSVSMDAPGESHLVIWDSPSRTHRVRKQAFTAVVADSVDLFAAAQVMTDRNWAEHPADMPLNLAVHGDTQFNVRVLSAGKEVYGVPLQVTSSDESVLKVSTASAFLAAGDVMHAHAYATGEADVEVATNGVVLKTAHVVSHPLSDLVGVDVLKTPVDDKPNDGDLKRVVAQRRLADGRPAWGVPMTWSAAGNALAGTADVLQYKFRKGASTAVLATLENLQATVQVEGDAVEVTSSGSGCSQSGGGMWGALLLLGALLKRSVRRVHRH